LLKVCPVIRTDAQLAGRADRDVELGIGSFAAERQVHLSLTVGLLWLYRMLLLKGGLFPLISALSSIAVEPPFGSGPIPPPGGVLVHAA
jgi:hypothetical protein